MRELIDKDALSEAHPPSGGRSSWLEKVRANVLPSIPNVSSWHIASFRCNAMIRRLSVAERTLASHPRGRIYELTL
jgi:hypothetical protein